MEDLWWQKIKIVICPGVQLGINIRLKIHILLVILAFYIIYFLSTAFSLPNFVVAHDVFPVDNWNEWLRQVSQSIEVY